MNGGEHLRLFVAISLPDEIKSALREAQRELQKLLPERAVRWTPPDQIHLTLRFFGNVPSEVVANLQSRLQSVCSPFESFDLTARGLGLFPDRKPPRIVWAGVHTENPQLRELHSAIQSATQEFGEPPDTRPFSAHLTLGRVKELRPRDRTVLRDFITRQTDLPFGEWRVREVELIRSELGSAGAKHFVVKKYSLKS